MLPCRFSHSCCPFLFVPPAGKPHGFGLEVGSKAELVMVMSQLAGRPPGTNLVCNGYKDAEYMELVSGCWVGGWCSGCWGLVGVGVWCGALGGAACAVWL